MKFDDRFLRITWGILIAVITTQLAFVYPSYIVFNYFSTTDLIWIEAAVTAIFLFDIFINDLLKRAWHNKRFSDSSGITSSTSRISLIVDILAAVPFVLVFNSKILILLRLLKLVRVGEMMHELRQWANRYSNQLTILFFFFWITLIAHWLCSGWLLLNVKPSDTDVWSWYVDSLYWTITTLTTVGYGDITPVTNAQKFYAMFVELAGVLTYGYLIGNVVNILSKKDPSKIKFRENMEKLSALSRLRNLPSSLQERIKDYYVYMWKKKMGFDEAEFINGLPIGLKKEVSLQLKKEIVEKIPLFQNTTEHFLMEIALRLKPMVSIPGEIIFRQGDIGHEMFFIVKGKVAIIKSETKVVKILNDGDFFGEIALFKNVTRNATVRSESYCDLYCLDKENFDFVMNQYPAFASKIEELVNQRTE